MSVRSRSESALARWKLSKPLSSYVSAVSPASRRIDAVNSTRTIDSQSALSLAMRDATANPENLIDSQVKGNLVVWRNLAAAALNNDSTFARAIQSANLSDRLMNPVVLDAKYSSPSAVTQMNAVIRALDALPANAQLTANFCNNRMAINDAIESSGAAGWSSSNGCADLAGTVGTSVLGSATLNGQAKATSTAGITDPVMSTKAAAGVSAINDVIGATSGLTSTTSFNTMSDLYRSLGAGTLVSTTIQAAQDNRYKVLLGELCQQKGATTCANSLSPAFAEMDQAVAGAAAPKVGWWDSFKSMFSMKNFWKSIATLLGAVVVSFMTIYAKLVSALTPFGVAMARCIAIIMSILGIYLLILPNRTREGIQWLIAPIAFANLWGTLYIFWWKVSDLITDWGWEHLSSTFFSGNEDNMTGLATMHFVSAIGYTALPMIAWSIVFSLTPRMTMNSGIGGMINQATNTIVSSVRTAAVGAVIGRSMRGGGSGGGGAALGTGGGGGRTMDVTPTRLTSNVPMRR